MVRLAIAGAAGKMGRRILALASQRDDFRIVAALEASGHPELGNDAGELAGIRRLNLPIRDTLDTDCDALIEFSLPAGTSQWVQSCLDRDCPIVIGTTGHSAAQLATIESASRSIPVLRASNMSVGINLLFKLVAKAAAALGDDYDIEIIEAHHRFKADAPSGTALSLKDAVVEATARDAEKDVIHGRQGQTGQRPPRQIGMHALRLGDTVGEHEVHFGTLGETIVFKHSAHTRDTFASGALRAAAWVVGQPPGQYSMLDVLGF